MEVYIEDIFIDNFIIDFIILFLAKKLLKNSAKYKRLLLASFVGVIFTILNLYLNLFGVVLLVYKLLLGVLIVLTAFGFKKLFLNYITFLFTTFLLGGASLLICFTFGKIAINNSGVISYSLGLPVGVIMGILFTCGYFVLQVFETIKSRARLDNFVCEVKICYNNRELNLKAFIDTGNTLVDPISNKPIAIISYDYFKRVFKNISLYDILLRRPPSSLKNAHYIKAGTVHQKDEILIFTIENLKIKQKKSNLNIKNAFLGLSFANFEKSLDCGLLLNPSFLNGEYNE